MAILSTDASTALRRKTARSDVYSTAGAIAAPFFVAPRALKITGISVCVIIVFVGGPTAINIGTAAVAAAYGTVTTSATAAANSIANATAAQLTGLIVPAGTAIFAASAIGTTGTYFVTLDWEPVEQDILT